MNTFAYMNMHICKDIHRIHRAFMHSIHRRCIDGTMHRFMHHRNICKNASVCVCMCTIRDQADGSIE